MKLITILMSLAVVATAISGIKFNALPSRSTDRAHMGDILKATKDRDFTACGRSQCKQTATLYMPGCLQVFFDLHANFIGEREHPIGRLPEGRCVDDALGPYIKECRYGVSVVESIVKSFANVIEGHKDDDEEDEEGEDQEEA
jgi:hypothetical protein